MAGALIKGSADPGGRESLLDAVERLVSAGYDRDEAGRSAVDAAVPEVIRTTARLSPRKRNEE